MGIENSIDSNSEGGGALLTITTRLLPNDSSKKDITSYFSSSLPDNLIIICNKSYDIEYFKNNFKELFEHTQDYLLKCIKILQEEKQKVINKKLKVSEVLEYFKENQYSKEKLKKVLDNHLSLLKRNRSDIMDSWKYYNEFLKL